MNLQKSWTIAKKDLSIFRTKKSILASVVLFPVLVSVGLSLVVRYSGTRSGNGISAAALPTLLDAFSFFFVIGAVILPNAIASYSLVGEKVQKSLEPLLAKPTTDGELLLGKAIAAFLPPVLAIYGGSVLFMVLMDRFTQNTLGYLYFPNWTIATILLFVIPLSALFAVAANVIISSRMNDIRSAQQLGSLLVLPYAGIYVLGEVNSIARLPV